MNDFTITEVKERTYYVQATADGSPRLIKAKSAAAVRNYLVLKHWTEPRVANVEDVERAMTDGVRVENV